MNPLPDSPPDGLLARLDQGVRLSRAVWQHPANRQQRVRGLARFVAWQFIKHGLKRPIVISFHGKQLKCYPDSTSTSGALYFGGYPDYWEMMFLRAYLRPGDHFLDIGANTGVYSILASAYIGSSGSVDAFEPADRTAGRIEEQAALNGLDHLRVHRLAVCDQDGQFDFGYSTSDAMMHLRRSGEPAQNRMQVTGIRLDKFEPYQRYAAGKMDIEGAEPLALAGAEERLRQANPPVWLLELAGYSTLYGVSSDEMVQRLAEARFECAVFQPETGTLAYTSEPWTLGVQNVLAVARTHRDFVAQRLRQNQPATA